jgi:hypothetical protein
MKWEDVISWRGDFGVRLPTPEKIRYQQYKKYEFEDACNIINIQ